DKLLRLPGWLTVRIIKGWPRVGVSFAEHAFFRWRRAIDRDDFDAACFYVSQSNITGAVRIFPDFLRDLLVAGHLLRIRRVVALLHRQFLELRVGARRSIASVNRNFSAGTA